MHQLPARSGGAGKASNKRERNIHRDEDEEPVEDSYDRFVSRGQKPY